MARAWPNGLRQQYPAWAVVLMGGYNDATPASELPVLSKPCPPDELLAAMSKAIATTARRRAEVGAGGDASDGEPSR